MSNWLAISVVVGWFWFAQALEDHSASGAKIHFIFGPYESKHDCEIYRGMNLAWLEQMFEGFKSETCFLHKKTNED